MCAKWVNDERFFSISVFFYCCIFSFGLVLLQWQCKRKKKHFSSEEMHQINKMLFFYCFHFNFDSVFSACVHISACAKSFTFQLIFFLSLYFIRRPLSVVCLCVFWFMLFLSLGLWRFSGNYCFIWSGTYSSSCLRPQTFKVLRYPLWKYFSVVNLWFFIPGGLLVKRIKVRRFKDSLILFAMLLICIQAATTKTAPQKRYEWQWLKKKKNLP